MIYSFEVKLNEKSYRVSVARWEAIKYLFSGLHCMWYVQVLNPILNEDLGLLGMKQVIKYSVYYGLKSYNDHGNPAVYPQKLHNKTTGYT